jgi:hypothetical protein
VARHQPLPQYPLVCLPEHRSRIHPEFLGESVTDLLVDVQPLRLMSRRPKGLDQDGVQRLVQRITIGRR